MERKDTALCRWLRIQYATFVLLGFAAGLMFVYVVLLSGIHQHESISIIETTLESITQSKEFKISPTSTYKFGNIVRDATRNITSSSLWLVSQMQRRHLVSSVCDELRLLSNISISSIRETLRDNDNILVDPRHRVVYCAIPKSACSSWRSTMAVLTKRFPNMNPEALSSRIHSPPFMKSIGLPSPSDLTEKQFSETMTAFTKFLVVRHPLERLVSAYRDKFETYNKWTRHFQMKYGRKIVSLYRGKNATTEALTNGHDVTFVEFLTFILDDSIPVEERRNHHWNTYQNLCHPCQVGYDHVVRFETLAKDNDEILTRYFSVNNSAKFFPRRNVKSVPSKDIMSQYYSTVPGALFQKIYAHIRTDMEMFGYTIPPYLKHYL